MGTIRILRVENDKNCSAEFCPTFVVHAASEWKVLLIASREGIVEKPSWDYLQIVLKQKNGSAIVRFTPQEKVIYLAQ